MFDDVDDFDVDDKNKTCISLFTGKGAAEERTIENRIGISQKPYKNIYIERYWTRQLEMNVGKQTNKLCHSNNHKSQLNANDNDNNSKLLLVVALIFYYEIF